MRSQIYVQKYILKQYNSLLQFKSDSFLKNATFHNIQSFILNRNVSFILSGTQKEI